MTPYIAKIDDYLREHTDSVLLKSKRKIKNRTLQIYGL